MTSTRETAIPRGSFALSAQLHLPDGFSEDHSYPGVVIATPGSSVKEQIAANYGRELAARGFVALAFDPAYQGQSGGRPRDLEDPAERVADLRYAVTFLATSGHVSADRIGALGICAGGGYVVEAAKTDHRVRAVGTVVPVNIGRAFREAAAASGPEAITTTLENVARAALADRDHEEAVSHAWLPDSLPDAEAAGVTDPDVLQAVTYYRTARGRSEYSTNRRHDRSDALILGFDAFHLVDLLLSQPVQVVVAGVHGSTGSLLEGRQLAGLAPAAEEVVVIDGARHYEMYDDPGYIGQAVGRLARFFDGHLGPTPP